VIGIAHLTAKLLEQGRIAKQRIGRVTISLNPFVPKPWTPFQWDPMENGRSLKRKIALLRRHVAQLGRIELDAESPREAYFQTLVSRGDRRVGRILERLNAERRYEPGAIWHGIAAIRREIESGGAVGMPDPDQFVHRAYGHDETLPWDFIDHHIEKWFLLSERNKARYLHQTPPCDVTRCKVCGAC